jgi:hypothetical protein
MRKARALLAAAAAATTLSCTIQPQLSRLEKSRVAPPPEIVNLEISNYQPATGRSFRELFAHNFSVKVNEGDLEYSAARDGLSDAEKLELGAAYGFSVGYVDSDGNLFSDLVMYLAGVQRAQQTALFCATNLRASTTTDGFFYTDTRIGGPAFLGLRDCEKAYLALDPKKFDNDSDGIPDYLELRCGLNPKNPNDVYLIPTGDGVTNLEKCKRQIPLNEDARSQPNQVFAHRYRTEVDAAGRHKFFVENIPVLQSGRDNFLALFLTEYDAGTGATELYSAFLRITPGASGRTLKFDFWGTSSAVARETEITGTW